MNLNELRQNKKVSEEIKLKVLKDTGFQLGRILEEARILKDKTQQELASQIGSTQSVIARIEGGMKLPSFSFLQKIADAFETYLIPPKFGFMEEKRIADFKPISIFSIPPHSGQRVSNLSIKSALATSYQKQVMVDN